MVRLGSDQALAAQVEPGATAELVLMLCLAPGAARLVLPEVTNPQVKVCGAGKISCSAWGGLLLPAAVRELLTTWSVAAESF